MTGFLPMKLEHILTAAIRKENFCIPKEMVITGSFRAETSGQIAGTVNGDVQVKGRVVILKDGIVNGDIAAEELIVYGRLTGDVTNCIKMTVHSGAVIRGNIAATEIHTEKDAVIEGLISKPGVSAPISKKKESKLIALLRENNKPATDSSGPAKQETWF